MDCNFYDESCLVVYSLDNEVDFYRIDGRYMSMNASTGVDEASSSPNFAISDLNNEYRPFVAWSEPDQNYMVAYTWPYAGGGQRWPAYSVVMEYYDYGTPPVLKGTTYGIDSDLGNENEKYSNGIAYDNCSEQYVIMVGHDYNGDGSDYDVYASVIDGGGFSIWGTIPIAITYAQENSPDISYIKDAEFAMFNPTPDRLVITYYRDGYLDLDGIIATDLRGNCDPNNPWYSTDPAYLHSVVLNSGGDEYLTRDPSITGSNDGREFFVAFTYLDVGDYDIYGRYMTIVDKNFLPILLKY